MFVYALLNMDDLTKHRKDRLRALIDGSLYAGNQAEFGRKAGLTKARITQLLNPDESFGERAAENLCAKLGLPSRWFEQGLAATEGEMLPAGGRVEAPNVTALPAPALRGLDGVLTELQAVLDGLSPLLQDAGRTVLVKWVNGQASRSNVVDTLEKLQQASAGTMPGAENRAA